MDRGELLILGGPEVRMLLENRDPEVVEAVRKAYLAHHRRQTDLPHSSFLRFPSEPGNRIIALPAYLGDVLARCPLVSFATTAGEPHVYDLSVCPPGATVLHVSLRDLSPEVILAADNVVDDPDHVSRARTSIHLTEERTGGRGFIRCTLAEILDGSAPPKRDPEAVTVFSPFGLGVLDLAVASRVLDLAREAGVGLPVPSFSPDV